MMHAHIATNPCSIAAHIVSIAMISIYVPSTQTKIQDAFSKYMGAFEGLYGAVKAFSCHFSPVLELAL